MDPPDPIGLSVGSSKAELAQQRQRQARTAKAARVNGSASSVEALLIQSGLSKAEIRETIALLGSKYGLQTIPMRATPIVVTTQGVSGPIGPGSASTGTATGRLTGNRAPPPAKAAWKQDPEWRRLSATRDEIVGEIKNLTDGPRKVQLVAELASLNAALKSQKSAARQRTSN
jgi:hypothetical protein